MSVMTDDMKAYFDKDLAYIATVDHDGNPDVGPKMSLRVLDDSHLIYNEMTGKQIYSNIKDNGKAIVAVADLPTMKGYRFGGTATAYTEGKYFDMAKEWAEKGGHPAAKAAVVIEIDTIWTLDAGPKAGELV
ncbi:pyridoxamine 5'-phosphate oxidase family protein [Pediococcus stilesii]|uniref:Pyridoxamine 5-phosphate oxidase-related FMN-binding protein n=1 Tax=Pediococcus stilesii TaxID=331679 RepID=A0A0R2KWN7_9LACO|nr:pyridoxamine 5'-phosphate oxidase family protein [Pediococcus stilesii]KRN93792.1 pyridoxamine 5-phosphate oxidase-related FMN-binding protein [Pediococcus stilesii]